LAEEEDSTHIDSSNMLHQMNVLYVSDPAKYIVIIHIFTLLYILNRNIDVVHVSSCRMF
jgi:hypothetical protein